MSIEQTLQEINEKVSQLQTNINSFLANKESVINESEGEKFLTKAELSKLIHMPQSTIDFHRTNNCLPFIKPGKKVLFDKKEVLEWLSKYSNGAILKGKLFNVPKVSNIRLKN